MQHTRAKPRPARKERQAPEPAAAAQPDSAKGSKSIAPGDDEALAMQGVQRNDGAAWAPNAPTADNEGSGNCLYHALAALNLGGKPRSHRQLRRFVGKCLTEFESDFKEVWKHSGEYNCGGRERACTWENFLEEQSQNASWGGVLEIAALCRCLNLRGWLLTDKGKLHSINLEGTEGFFALRYKDDAKHYVAYVDPIEREFQRRYDTLGGKSAEQDTAVLRGGLQVRSGNARLSRTALLPVVPAPALASRQPRKQNWP